MDYRYTTYDQLVKFPPVEDVTDYVSTYQEYADEAKVQLKALAEQQLQQNNQDVAIIRSCIFFELDLFMAFSHYCEQKNINDHLKFRMLQMLQDIREMTPFMLLDADSNLSGQERAQHILMLEKSKLIEYIDQKLVKVSTLPDAIKKSREEQLN